MPTTSNISPRLLTIPQAAEYLGRSVFSMRTLIWNGFIPVVQTGKKIWIDIKDLDTFIESNKTVFPHYPSPGKRK